jgi:HK97 family phage portal protein
VDESATLSSSAFWAGVRLISESLSTVPLHVYQMQANGERRVVREHPVDDLIYSSPNPEMTAQEWRSQMMAVLILTGNAYNEIVRDRGGRIRQLWPLSWYRVELKRAQDDSLYYQISTTGLDDVTDRQTVAILPSEQVLHLRGFNTRGLLGESMVTKLRETIGISLATESFGASFYGSGTTLSGVLQHPGELSEAAQKRLKLSWDSRHSGLSKSHRIAILEEGMKFTPISVPPEAAQFLETRQFQVQEAARALRLPPHMLGDLSRATFSNVEQQAIEFVTHSLRPWASILEQRMQLSLLTPAERAQGYYIRHNLEGLLRGDIKARYDAYAIGRQWGWLSVDDVRALEDLNPIEGGDVYLQPMNMVPAGSAGMVPLSEAEESDTVRALRTEMRQTNFPSAGDDQTISLANSQYDLPPLNFVERIREDYPEIWGRGGNVEGNRSDRILREIRENSIPADQLTETQREKIREREAWSARHFEDFQLAGVVAQLKWHMVGSRGFGHMRDTINEAIERLERSAERATRTVDLREHTQRSADQRRKMRDVYQPLLMDAAQSLIKGEVRALRKAINDELRGASSMTAWVNRQYGPQMQERVARVLGPVIRAYQQQVAVMAGTEMGGDPGDLASWINSYIDMLARRYVGYNKTQLLRVIENMNPDELAESLEKLAEKWEADRAQDVADEEAVRAGSAILRAAYAALGVAAVRWVADSDPCDFCMQMAGTVVTTVEPFAGSGTAIETSTGELMQMKQTIMNPPLHRGCQCEIVPER